MKYLIGIVLILGLLIAPLSDSFSEHGRRHVTPYGDFCRKCTKYGTCKSTMSHDKAKRAILDYYNEKGLAVEIEKKRGRFIKVKVMDRDNVVDVIIFDRRTGRVRSIY